MFKLIHHIARYCEHSFHFSPKLFQVTFASRILRIPKWVLLFNYYAMRQYKLWCVCVWYVDVHDMPWYVTIVTRKSPSYIFWVGLSYRNTDVSLMSKVSITRRCEFSQLCWIKHNRKSSFGTGAQCAMFYQKSNFTVWWFGWLTTMSAGTPNSLYSKYITTNASDQHIYEYYGAKFPIGNSYRPFPIPNLYTLECHSHNNSARSYILAI